MKSKNKTVFVGLSGGVDSSVAAALLKEAGYEVVGVFIKVWQPDFLECAWREERRDAMRVCAKLDIPFLTFDFEKIYKREVADYMIREYRAGRTPNPDVMCNKKVKFGEFLKKALAMGADYVATGHYARIGLKAKSYQLQAGLDPAKDQSYFLWTLKQDQLKHILFPVGHLKKSQVRKLAKKYGLHTFEKKDSQGICFLGKLDMKEFLKHYIKPKRGRVILAGGKPAVIGHHPGALFFTLGERHGFTITKKSPRDKPYYVIAKDIKKNTITVSQKETTSPPSPLSLIRRGGTEGGEVIHLKDTNWISKPDPKKIYQAQIRYHGELLPCQAECQRDSLTAKVIFEKSAVVFQSPQLVSPGQSVVIYDNSICLGGGIVV